MDYAGNIKKSIGVLSLDHDQSFRGGDSEPYESGSRLFFKRIYGEIYWDPKNDKIINKMKKHSKPYHRDYEEYINCDNFDEKIAYLNKNRSEQHIYTNKDPNSKLEIEYKRFNYSNLKTWAFQITVIRSHSHYSYNSILKPKLLTPLEEERRLKIIFEMDDQWAKKDTHEFFLAKIEKDPGLPFYNLFRRDKSKRSQYKSLVDPNDYWEELMKREFIEFPGDSYFRY